MTRGSRLRWSLSGQLLVPHTGITADYSMLDLGRFLPTAPHNTLFIRFCRWALAFLPLSSSPWGKSPAICGLIAPQFLFFTFYLFSSPPRRPFSASSTLHRVPWLLVAL